MKSNFRLSQLQKFLVLFQPKYALVLNEHDSSGSFQVKFGLHYWRGHIHISAYDPVKIGVVSGVAYLHVKARRNWGRKKSERFQLLPTPFIWLRSLKFVWKSDCRSGIRTLFSLENNHNTRHFWLPDERFIQPSYDSNSARIRWTNGFLQLRKNCLSYNNNNNNQIMVKMIMILILKLQRQILLQLTI